MRTRNAQAPSGFSSDRGERRCRGDGAAPAAAPSAVEPVVGGKEPVHQRLKGRQPFLGEAEVELAGGRLKVLTRDGHGAPPACDGFHRPCLLAHPAGVNVDR
jgi:hypothetical protein